MHRGLGAACAALITCATLYPIDTWKAAAQLNVPKLQLRQAYAGLVPELVGTFVGTGLYFTTYEATRNALALDDNINTASACVAGVCVSYFARTPMSAFKRRKQAEKAMNVVPASIDSSIILKAYLLDVCRALPKAIIKYLLYENLMVLFMTCLSRSQSAAVSAAASSLVAYTFGVPFENRKTALVVSSKGITSFRGIGRGLLLTTLSNGMGHALLECWSPRV